MDSSSSASSSSSHQYKGAVSFPASSTSSVVRPRWPDLPIYESTPHYPPMENSRFASSASPYSNYGYDYATHSLAGVRGGEAGDRSIAAGEDESTEVLSEKEHMFDKVVTPSDVGKLNRLVIPKQHAEKYFPLDSTSGDNSKGLLLNFEDRSGKSWRFRYSYWNSSQSYVMTKGWSRFVKEKKLDAGDIVSFHRGVSEKDRFYIDWRRRPDAPPYHHALYNTVQFQNGFALHRPIINHPPFYTLSPPMPPPTLLNHHQHAHARGYNALTANSNSTSSSGGGGGCYGGNYGIVSPNFCQHHHHHQQQSGSVIYLGAAAGGAPQQQMRGSQRMSGGGIDEPMVFDSVPVVEGGKAAGKRLRLFGVNMDCTDPQEERNRHHLREFVLDSDRIDSSSTSLGAESALQLRLSGGASSTGEFVEKGKSSSMSLDLDI